jgi:hypothetical protein
VIRNKRATKEQNAYPGIFAAELTDAAYRVALRHGVSGSAIDLELNLWHVIAEKVRIWEQEVAPER